MIRTLSFETLSTCLLGNLLALGLYACGSPSEPLGAREQPFSAADDANDTDGTNDPDDESAASACAEGMTPAEAPDGFCQVTARGLCFDSAESACACAGCGSDVCLLAESFPAQAFCPRDGAGSAPSAPVGSDPDAPVSSEPSVGGGTDAHPGGQTSPGFPGAGVECGSPGQTEPAEPSGPVACADGSTPEADDTSPCNFIGNGACFDDVDAACACAGCGAAACIIRESYPAVVICQ